MIMQSGTALGPGGYQEQKDFKPHVEKLAKKFRCSTSSSQLIIYCLRKVNSNDLVKSSSLTETMEYGHAIWIPTIESKKEGAILTESPLSAINNDKTKRLPLLSGNCADEGLSITDRKD